MAATDTTFHKIMRKEIPADIVHEDQACIAIRDINPQAEFHLLVIPKKTMPSLREGEPEDEALLGHLLLICAELARKEGFSADGYRVVINAGENGGQEVPQLHLHVLGGRKLRWPPG